MYTTLLAVVAFGDRWPRGAEGFIQVAGTTDNAGNTYCLARLMSTKFPLVVILSELSEQLRRRRMHLHLAWAPRDQNEAADSLSNGEFHEFDERLRVPLDVSQIDWVLMNSYMEAAESLLEDTRRNRGSGVARPSGGPRGSLRETDPW